MPRVDFYLVSGDKPEATAVFACRLVDKAYRLGRRVYIAVDSQAQAQEMDALLWTFAPSSFVPHAVAGVGGEGAGRAPVLIGTDAPTENIDDVLLTLCNDVPDWFARFERIAEVIGGDETQRAAGRRRFRTYREHDCEPVINNV